MPMNTMAIALGCMCAWASRTRCSARDGERATSVQQIEKMVRIARELNRDIASGDEARASIRSAPNGAAPTRR